MEAFAIVHESEFSGVETVVDAFQCKQKGDHAFRFAIALCLKRLRMPEQERGFQFPISMKARKIGKFSYRLFLEEDPLIVPKRQGIVRVRPLAVKRDGPAKILYADTLRELSEKLEKEKENGK